MSDVEFLLSWFLDIREAGYEFPSFFNTCNASKGADPNADPSLYVVAKPIELLKAAFQAQTVYFCCGESSLTPWRHWIGNPTVPAISPKIADLGTEGSPVQESTIVLEMSRLSLSDLREALYRLSDAQTFVIYHSTRTFCPPACEDEDGVAMM